MSTLNDMQEQKYFKLLDEVSIEDMKQDIDFNVSRNKNKIRRKRVIQFSAAAISFIIIFFGGMIISPSFANAVSQIPILKPLVQMLALDKGITDIIENDYIEPMNISQTIDGKTVTITGVVADESGMIILYKFESDEDLHNFNGFTPNVLQGEEQVSAGIGSSWYPLEEGTFEVESTVEISANPPMDYTYKDFTLILNSKSYNSEIEFKLPFTLNNEIVKSKLFEINKDVIIDNQKITVLDLTISPLRTEIRMSIDKDNSKKILSLSHITILDENGEQWGTIRNGVTGWGLLTDDDFKILLESNYFRIPKKITILFSNIEAVDKEDAYIEVDFNSKTILHQPSNIDIDLKIKDNYEVAYEYTSSDSNKGKMILGDMIDSSEQRFHLSMGSIRTQENLVMIQQYYKVNDQQHPPKNPVKIEISHYESYLEGTAQLEIDLE